MKISESIFQVPDPGTRLIKFRGDTQKFTLSLSTAMKGTAWLRTNLGHADIARMEVIREVHQNIPPIAQDWFDIPMRSTDGQLFEAILPLCDVGHFEAKGYFLKKGSSQPLWPSGLNTVINVEPADTCCANIIYNAFVRQFGPNKRAGIDRSSKENWIKELDQAGYTVIPKSGTFRDLIGELDFIVGHLGCRILQLLPVHPAPTTYGRMGRFGSPYAALSFTAVDPALAEFDVHATPLEQFIELVDAIHKRNAKIFIDIAINHTGWAASLHETHPQWLVRGSDGRIEVPGAWGVLWEDLTKLDYTHKDLWQYMADVFLTWCRRGVDGFRCDAGYMIPIAAWRYMIAAVREQFPDTVFLLEGLGGKISVTRDLLNIANFNWTYSELFQNYDRGQIESYLPGAIDISETDGITVHFAETHDNPRLAARTPQYARMRTALCALCAPQGAFGFANGVEWFATEKINVHDAPSLNWGAEHNQVEWISRLNTLLQMHPAFGSQARIKLIQKDSGNYVALLRQHIPTGKKLIVLVNLDMDNPTLASWDADRDISEKITYWDLLTKTKVNITLHEGLHKYHLNPGQVLCLTSDRKDIERTSASSSPSFSIPKQIQTQCLHAKLLDIYKFFNGIQDLKDFDLDGATALLVKNPLECCRRLNPYSEEPRAIMWQWPRDLKREVMVPPDHMLIIHAPYSFIAQVMDKNRILHTEKSLPLEDGSFFTLFTSFPEQDNHYPYILKLSVFTPGKCEHVQAPLLLLTLPEKVGLKNIFHRSDLSEQPLILLQTNGRGGMLRANLNWGKLFSRYDAFLAGNLHQDVPVDRWIMLARCRMWLVFQDYSHDICFDCIDSFNIDSQLNGFWHFLVPIGQGQHVRITIELQMVQGENSIQLLIYRHPTDENVSRLADHQSVKLIIRPDIESRNFHDTTKAYLGPENLWPKAFTLQPHQFIFSPDPGHILTMKISKGNFKWEPEWHYMVHRPLEAERGLDPDSDLYSPGYFFCELLGNETIELGAQISSSQILSTRPKKKKISNKIHTTFKKETVFKPIEILEQVLNHYIVKRGKLKTVIAGYPWFLDWGRDALIFTRGLIATGKTTTARAVLKLFGQFEEQGTLPNMIRGADAGNRDTSDAPLWFFISCNDLVRSERNENFLDESCGNRTIRQILVSMAQSLMTGTPNGIYMDPDSGLIFNPAHFTWMDTNHPAATPREGYPIEIQALWWSALSFLAKIDDPVNTAKWEKLAARVRSSIQGHFWIEESGYLSDCLHTRPGGTALQAERDDALRPNQLLALTMGAVSDLSIGRQVLSACEELLIPGAIRSLADRPVQRPLAIVHQSNIINDPSHPYQGKYMGEEDLRRKPAYHNGTAWTWLFPSFCEAWVSVYGDKCKKTALSLLTSSATFLRSGCIGHIPEILDGDYPHIQRGCDAQAWGCSEWVRVWLKLTASSDV